MSDNAITAEIDLIPSDYRAHLARVGALRRFALILLSLLLIGGLAYTALRHQTLQMEREVGALERRTLITDQQRQQIARLRDVAKDFQHQLAMLGRLRSGGQAQDMFTIIDRAISPGDVWFRMWTFRRAGFVIEGDSNQVNRGYLAVIPADGGASSSKPWQVETHMSIKGQARDHSTLSNFVQNLFNQAQIQDVRVINTARSRYKDTSVVDFDLRIVLRSTAEDG